MTQVSRATWGTSLTTLINDNTAGEISAADVRSVLTDLEDSLLWFDEAELNTINSDPTGVTGADAVTNIMSLTQAEYDAITPNASTFYVIVG